MSSQYDLKGDLNAEFQVYCPIKQFAWANFCTLAGVPAGHAVQTKATCTLGRGCVSGKAPLILAMLFTPASGQRKG